MLMKVWVHIDNYFKVQTIT